MRDPLVTVTCVAIMLAIAGYATGTVVEKIGAVTHGLQGGKLEERAYTNSSVAHFTLTNLNGFDAEACFRGVVARNSGSGRAETAAVCSGTMKPRTTVTLEAPYGVNDIDKLCSGEADRFGNQHVDWSRCTFTTEPIAAR